MTRFGFGLGVVLGSVAFAALPVRAQPSTEHQHGVEEHSAEEHKRHSPAPVSRKDLEGDAYEPAAAGHDMEGMFGPYPMSRESSGTSWQPESAPHQGIHAA